MAERASLLVMLHGGAVAQRRVADCCCRCCAYNDVMHDAVLALQTVECTRLQQLTGAHEIRSSTVGPCAPSSTTRTGSMVPVPLSLSISVYVCLCVSAAVVWLVSIRTFVSHYVRLHLKALLAFFSRKRPSLLKQICTLPPSSYTPYKLLYKFLLQ